MSCRSLSGTSLNSHFSKLRRKRIRKNDCPYIYDASTQRNAFFLLFLVSMMSHFSYHCEIFVCLFPFLKFQPINTKRFNAFFMWIISSNNCFFSVKRQCIYVYIELDGRLEFSWGLLVYMRVNFMHYLHTLVNVEISLFYIFQIVVISHEDYNQLEQNSFLTIVCLNR